MTPFYLLAGATALLLLIGLLMVFSASSVYSYEHFHDSYRVFFKQLMWVAVAAPFGFLAYRLPQRALRRFARPALLVTFALVVLVETPLGYAVNGNRNWLALGPLTLQPSELAKLAVTVWVADLYARKDRLLDSPKHLLLPMVPVTGAFTLLILLEGDLGTALVFFALLLGLLWIAGVPLRVFGVAATVVAMLASLLAVTSPERMARLTTFSNPLADYQGAGWQAAHGLFALSRGGILGRGIGASIEKWGALPEAHTDFIFAVIGEELGLLGTLLLLALFLTIFYAGIRVAVMTRDPFVRYVSGGVVIWLAAQTSINLGMVLTLLPVIGIPLPLVSYGGSSMAPTLVSLSLLLGMAHREGLRRLRTLEVRSTPSATARPSANPRP